MATVEMTMKKRTRFCFAGLILILAGAALAGCAARQSTPTAASKSVWDAYTSHTLVASYPGALSASNQLMLGMLRLEGTDSAITPEQARTMLPVLQALQGQVLKSDAERTAALAYIEAQLTPAQLSAIANMRLTRDDLQTWMRESSQPGPGPQVTPGAGAGQGGFRPQVTPGAGQSGFRQQGTPGAAPGGVRPQGTPGARAAFGGAAGAAGAGVGQGNVLLNSVIRLLMLKSRSIAP